LSATATSQPWPRPIPIRLTKALAALKAEWNSGAADTDSRAVFDYFKQNARDAASTPALVPYRIAYIAHVPLEPRAAVAEWQGDKLTVWTGTQRPFGVKSELAQQFGINEDNVQVLVPDTGSATAASIKVMPR
jgi:isoquinoline 1-oxidoreductase